MGSATMPRGFSAPRAPCRSLQTLRCKATGGADRRDVLLSLGGAAAAGLLRSSSSSSSRGGALAAPIQPPDLRNCHPPDIPDTAGDVNCCPPPGAGTAIVDFTPPPPPACLRVRPAAHLVDGEYLAKYQKAVALMKQLPDDDPRSFAAQWRVHCAYCDGAFDQVGFPDLEIQIHNCWLFFPWHRFYLYFHERILGKLIGDDKFALPFWNWDAPGGMSMPAIYANRSSPLYDERRDPAHQPPFTLDLDYDGTEPTIPRAQQIEQNLMIMYRQATPKRIVQFMGVKELTISHVKSHLQMHRAAVLGAGRRGPGMQAQLLQRRYSCTGDEQGPKEEFLCPPLKSARMEYQSMQGSHGVSDARTAAAAGGLYCIDDYMQAMARIKEEGLIRWQRRDAAAATTAAAPSNLQAVGCLVQESDPFKIHRPEAHHLGSALNQQDASNKEDGNGCPHFSFSNFSMAAKDEPSEQCSLSLSLGLDPKCARAMAAASSPSGESSCILTASPARRSSSDCSGHSGCFVGTGVVSLELSLSICGS